MNLKRNTEISKYVSYLTCTHEESCVVNFRLTRKEKTTVAIEKSIIIAYRHHLQILNSSRTFERKSVIITHFTF